MYQQFSQIDATAGFWWLVYLDFSFNIKLLFVGLDLPCIIVIDKIFCKYIHILNHGGVGHTGSVHLVAVVCCERFLGTH